MNDTELPPKIAVTVGDPAGVGPEIVVKAFAHPETCRTCRPIVIGDFDVVVRAVQITGTALQVQRISQPDDMVSEGVLPILDIGSDGRKAPVGQVSSAGGTAAFAAIERGVELCMSGQALALATAPINKESLRLANVPYLDHTEALQKLTGAASVLTLFLTGGLRVFFLTRHIPFREVPRHIKKDTLVKFTEDCFVQLHRLGFSSPRIAIAALNPHAGESGMFGDEEILEIAPAVEELRSRGYSVRGPIPADTVFHIAREGAYDAVVSLYHDQGHIAAKTLDFYRTVSLTLGLPFLRSSVDHGTAFDLAGSGKANEISMVEAILVAARYGSRWQKSEL